MDIVVNAVLVHDNKVLIAKEGENYTLIESKAQDKELLKDTVFRAVKERTGQEIEAFAMLGVYDDVARNPTSREISMAYLCRLPEGKDHSYIETKEDNGLIWVSVEDVVKKKYNLVKDHSKMITSYFIITQFGKNVVKEKK